MFMTVKSVLMTGLLAAGGLFGWQVSSGEQVLDQTQPVIQFAEDEPDRPEPMTPEERAALREFMADKRLEILANALGLSVDVLEDALASGQTVRALFDQTGMTAAEGREALQEAWAAALDEAVSQGLLSEEQAAFTVAHPKLVRKVAQNNRRLLIRELLQTATADALGITREELVTARAAGTTVRELASEQGMDQAEFRTALESAVETAVEQAVSDGMLSEAQAARLLDRGRSRLRP